MTLRIADIDELRRLSPALARQAERALGVVPARPEAVDVTGAPRSKRVAGERERTWQATVERWARARGWWAYHTNDSRRSEPGFPDLVMIRERVVYAELKRRGESLRPEQVMVLGLLRGAGAEAYAWWPDDEAEVLEVLERRGA